MCSKLEKETHLISQMFRKQLHAVISAQNKIRNVLDTSVLDAQKLENINNIILKNDEILEEIIIENLNQ